MIFAFNSIDLATLAEHVRNARKVGYAVYEHPQRLAQHVLIPSHNEARAALARITIGLVLRLPHRLQPPCQRQRVAVVAAWRDPTTPRCRVPRVLGPLDLGRRAHRPSPPTRVRLSIDGRPDRGPSGFPHRVGCVTTDIPGCRAYKRALARTLGWR